MRKNKYFFILLLCFLLCQAQNAFAIKANPRPVTIEQPDGTILTVRLYGDENFHYVTTIDGYLISRDRDGYFKYIDTGKAGNLRTISKQIVHNFDKRESDETHFVNTLTPLVKLKDALLQSPRGSRKAPAQILGKDIINPVLRTRAGEAAESQYLVILVNFKDKAFSFESTDFDKWLNEKNYSVDGGTGSVKDYYRDNSMGKFIPNFSVVGPYTLEHEQIYYAGNDKETGEDVNPRGMVVEACQMAKADNPNMDFSKYDNDKDGYMDNVYVIYAGYSEASTGNGDDMWPHSWTLRDEAIIIDGITINNYSCSAELVGASGTKMDGIGTFTHEFGHILGLKDMYDTDEYLNGYGIDPGDYSLYASGSYNNDSRTPPCLMAFERMQMGWCEPVELNAPEDVALSSIADNVARYINAQPGRAEGTGHEWFILENRQNKGWDTYLPAHGLLIYHYDYTQEMVEKYWSVNGPNNNATHRCMYIKAADGIDDTNTRNGDTYPGRSGNTEFTDTSVPNALNWKGEKTNTPITNILEKEGIVYFQVKGGVENWAVIRTEVPEDIRDTSVKVTATLKNKTQDITEMGFCWALKEEPTIQGTHQKVEVADQINYTIIGLQPGSIYNVRAYMLQADGTVVYGAAIPFTTECKVAVAPYIGDFTSWTNGEPDCWKVIDNNGDGTTWIFDESSGGIVYQFDYWNNADDWLISTRMLVPENGSLYFMRGVTESTTLEKLDVYISTHSRELKDFHLLKHFSFADRFGEMVPEEIDLSEYVGKEVYIAFVCRSEKLQNNLWLWQIYLTSRLGTPTITKFEKAGEGTLNVEWTSVSDAKKYFLEFSEVTDEVYTTSVFVPITYFTRLEGQVEANTGSLNFTGSGIAETRNFVDGITNCLFIITSSGPTGTTVFNVEGTLDGTTWEQIGPTQRVSEFNSEGIEMILTDYMKGKKYLKVRFNCQYGGRNIRLKYLTLEYNDGKVWNQLAAGAVNGTSMPIEETTPGEFTAGKTYVVQVYAGDGILFYGGSDPVYLTTSTGIEDAMQESDVRFTTNGSVIYAKGLNAGDRIICTTTSGLILYDAVANGTEQSFPVNGYEGIVMIRLIKQEGSSTTKLIIK